MNSYYKLYEFWALHIDFWRFGRNTPPLSQNAEPSKITFNSQPQKNLQFPRQSFIFITFYGIFVHYLSHKIFKFMIFLLITPKIYITRILIFTKEKKFFLAFLINFIFLPFGRIFYCVLWTFDGNFFNSGMLFGNWMMMGCKNLWREIWEILEGIEKVL